MDKKLIIDQARKIIKIDINHLHGINHWQRVEQFGHYLADFSGAEKNILSLFAYLHDLGRENDDEDFYHGERSAEIAKSFFEKGIIQATTEEMDKLIYACQYHNKAEASSDDLTIQTCWDSDRLDMWRANIEPNPLYLFTNQAKKSETIIMARNFSLGKSDSLSSIL